MKAVVYTEYGPPEVLRLKELARPTPSSKEVLIKVHAATVTSGDVNARGFTFVPRGFGPLPRLGLGLRRPRRTILGTEVAGVIEAVGSGVHNFKPGDQVFGIDSTVLGAYAQYVCRPAAGPLVTMPVNLSYEEAAALPGGAGTAIYFLRDLAQIQSGQQVLVNGASGGVGSAAVQLAKYYGAETTGVCSTANLDLVKSLGADNVIDYTQEDFTQSGQRYDIIYDTVGKAPFSKSKAALKEDGIYLDGPSGPSGFLRMAWTSVAGRHKVYAGTPPENKEELSILKELAEAGQLRPIIDRRFPLEETAAAHRYVDQGHKKGNVVITVAHA